MKRLILICVIILVVANTSLFSQTNDTLPKTFKEKIKKGWNFGLVPAVSLDPDLGFRYGIIVNAFDYGNVSRYPKYDNNIYLELSQTTGGNKTAKLAYDSDFLIPKLRSTFNIQYLTEKALDFYGFNGYESLYNSSFENSEDPEYKSQMFYRIDRKFFMALADFQKDIPDSKLKIIAGLNFYNNVMGSVNIEKINKRKDSADMLPSLDSVPGLFEHYIQWKIIPESDIKGGNAAVLKAGLVYDSRDNEPNPMKGIWSEMLFLAAPKIADNFCGYTQLVMSHRQYFTLKKEVLNFAYRLSYQTKLTGDIPYYMLPLVYFSNKSTRDGLGGAKTIRGMKRNRVVGEGMAYGNAELRWKFFRKVIGGQNIFLVWSAFCDAGRVTSKNNIDLSLVPQEWMYLFPDTKETVHLTYGTGLHFVMNQNFIVAFDYGFPLNKSDGKPGLYVNLDFLF